MSTCEPDAYSTATVFLLALGLLIFSLSLPPQSLAEDTGYPEPSGHFSREALAQMLAPIALYPDVLLSQVLMAATYPLEVAEANRWVKNNSELTGPELDEELLDKDWAPSVKALCHFPAVLDLMNERIAETTNIGNAFLVQEKEVIAVIQELRDKAYAQGNLVSTFEQEVIVDNETIIIKPKDPEVIYVPYYDPLVVYGPWMYPDFPPYYWAPGSVKIGRRILYWPRFYSGFTFGTWNFFDWRRHYIFIDAYQRPRFVRRDHWRTQAGPWHHIPRHRRGVAYRDKNTARKYGQYHYSARDHQDDTRGFPEDRERDEFKIPSRDWSLDDQRSRFQFPDRIMPWEDSAAAERERMEREQADRDRQRRERMARERKERERAARERQERERVRVERELQQRERAGVEKERQYRQRTEPGRIERDYRVRRQVEQERQMRQRHERERHEGERDNVFNRVEDGRRESRFSERGSSSRRQERIDGSRSRGGIKRGDSRSRGDEGFLLR